MSAKIGAVLATVVLLAFFCAVIAERSIKSDCVRSGIQAGWATEAIKELCK